MSLGSSRRITRFRSLCVARRLRAGARGPADVAHAAPAQPRRDRATPFVGVGVAGRFRSQ